MPNPKVRVSTSAFDKALEAEASEYFSLSIQLSLDGFSFCVFDTQKNKFLGLQSFRFSDVDNESALCQVLDELISSISLLNVSYQKTSIMIESRRSTLIPEALFDEERQRELLGFNHKVMPEDIMKNDQLTIAGARNIWAFHPLLAEIIKKYFPTANISHHSSALIEGVLRQYKCKDKHIFVHLRKNCFDIMVFQQEKLLFYNVFNFKTREDFVYYIIYVSEQLGLNPDSVQLTLSGEIMKVSSLQEIAFKYIRNIDFAQRSSAVDYSYVFDDIPGHFYFNLLKLQQCEL